MGARMRGPLVASLLLLATPAHADVTVGGELDLLDLVHGVARRFAPTQEARISRQLRELQQQVDDAVALANLLLANNPLRGGGLDVGATAGGGYDVDRGGADASAMLSAHLDGDHCALVRADVLVRGRTATAVDDRARASVDGSAMACFPDGIDFSASGLPITVFPIRGGFFGALNKTPSLTASRAVLAEPYSEAGFGVWTEGLRWLRDGGTRYYAFPGVSIEQRNHWRGFPTGEASRKEVVLDAYFFRLFRRREPFALADRAIDIFGFGAHGVQDETGTAVIEAWPARFRGFGLGTDYLLLDFVFGISGPGTLASDEGVDIDSMNVPDIDVVFVHGAIAGGTQVAAAGVTYDRQLETNLLAALVREDRVSAWTRHHRGPLRAEAAAFYSDARHYLNLTDRGDERLLGASLDASYAIGGGVSIGAALEATHALARDAILDGRVAPDGLRAFATVSVTQPLASWRKPPPPAAEPELEPARSPEPLPIAPPSESPPPTER